MFAIFKREFKAYFQSVIGWLFVAALLAVYGLYFYVYNLMQGYPYIQYSLSAITFILLIAVPILTMRSFAEDRKNKTDQLTLTAPVSIGKVVFGKYLAMVAVFTIDIAIFDTFLNQNIAWIRNYRHPRITNFRNYGPILHQLD